MTTTFKRLQHLTLIVNLLEKHLCADCGFFRRGGVCEASAAKCPHRAAGITAVDFINGCKSGIARVEAGTARAELRVAG